MSFQGGSPRGTPQQARRNLFPGSGATLSGSRGSSGGGGSHSGGGTTNLILARILFALFATMTSLSFIWTFRNMQMAMQGNSTNAHIASSILPKIQLQNKLAQTIQTTPIGSLGPSGAGKRQHYRYYDTLFYTAMQYGAQSQSVIEVGCASEPFLQYLGWIGQRTCVAPYFVEYTNDAKNSTNIEKITADFMEYELPNNNEKYDLLLCSQVLEHVPDPAAFMKKLISTAKVSIISVPFDWDDCGKLCNHVTDHITTEMILEWSAPHVPIHRAVVTEDDSRKGVAQRMILVYSDLAQTYASVE